MALLAILMKNRKEDGTFDFSFISEELESKITDEMEKNVRRSNFKDTGKKSKKHSNNILDYF